MSGVRLWTSNRPSDNRSISVALFPFVALCAVEQVFMR